PGGDLSRHCAQIEFRLCRLRRREAGGQGARLADTAHAYPQCADAADEGPRLREGLRVRPQCRGWLLRPELLPRRHGPRGVLSACRARLRARDPEAPGILEEAAREEALTERGPPGPLI